MGKSNYMILLDNLFEGVYYVDLDKKIKYWNNGAKKITGYSHTEVIGKLCSDNILMHTSLDGKRLCSYNCLFKNTLSTGMMNRTEVYFNHKEGYKVHVSVTIAPMYAPKGNIVGAIMVFTDNKQHFKIDEKEMKEHKEIYFDPVTKLPNKYNLEMMLNSKLHEFRRYNWSFAVFLFSVDNFDKLQKNYGDEAINIIQKKITSLIQKELRPFDTMGKWSNEIFAIFFTNINKTNLNILGSRIRKMVENMNISVGEGEITITISIGGSIIRKKDSIEILMDRTKNLLKQSTLKGGNTLSTIIKTLNENKKIISD